VDDSQWDVQIRFDRSLAKRQIGRQESYDGAQTAATRGLRQNQLSV